MFHKTTSRTICACKKVLINRCHQLNPWAFPAGATASSRFRHQCIFGGWTHEARYLLQSFCLKLIELQRHHCRCQVQLLWNQRLTLQNIECNLNKNLLHRLSKFKKNVFQVNKQEKEFLVVTKQQTGNQARKTSNEITIATTIKLYGLERNSTLTAPRLNRANTVNIVMLLNFEYIYVSTCNKSWGAFLITR